MKNNRALETETFKVELIESITPEYLLKEFESISSLYPNFEGWLRFRFLGNIASGTRKLLVAYNGNNIFGYSLLKDDGKESKICTFFIPELYRGKGIGSELMKKSIETLGSKDILITVSDERQAELSPILNSRGFKLEKSIPDVYRKGTSEHFWKL